MSWCHAPSASWLCGAERRTGTEPTHHIQPCGGAGGVLLAPGDRGDTPGAPWTKGLSLRWCLDPPM